MPTQINIRDYETSDVQSLANIYYNTIHVVCCQDYTEAQVNAWAPPSCLETEGWSKKFLKTKPLIAVVNSLIVGFAEFEQSGQIDCFYCHHEWLKQGVGSALMRAIHEKAYQGGVTRLFLERISITAITFFEKWGFVVIDEHTDIKRLGVSLSCYSMEKYLVPTSICSDDLICKSIQ